MRSAQPGLEPRIVTFEAKPATVRAGQPGLLIWHIENPSGVAIEPGIGAILQTLGCAAHRRAVEAY